MKIDLEAYNEHYHQGGKFIDNWQEGIKLLPKVSQVMAHLHNLT